MNSQTFTQVSPAMFASLRDKISSHGVTVPEGNTGTITGHTFFGSVTASYTFDAHNATLALTDIQTTGLVSVGDVISQVRSNLYS